MDSSQRGATVCERLLEYSVRAHDRHGCHLRLPGARDDGCAMLPSMLMFDLLIFDVMSCGRVAVRESECVTRRSACGA